MNGKSYAKCAVVCLAALAACAQADEMAFRLMDAVIVRAEAPSRSEAAALAEAAQDLGSTPAQAFFRVVMPAIMPGITSGLLMSFTLSLDDFVISYYTTGSDFQTLPLRIFAMTKKTVKPDMYALSTLIFVTVLVLLLAVNIGQLRQDKKNENK